MSDLAATNCGCGSCEGGNNSCIWIILLLLFCGGCGNGNGIFGGNNGCNFGCDCSIIVIILLLVCCCGNGNGMC